MANKKRELPRWCKDAKIAMIEKGISGPKELGELIGLSRVQVSRVINGTLLSDKTQERICDYLGVQSQ